MTDLSSLLHDGEAFIYYFKEVEKIITTVIPHLMCPEPPITPRPAAVSAERGGRGDESRGFNKVPKRKDSVTECVCVL